jgi:hypothetical protein
MHLTYRVRLTVILTSQFMHAPNWVARLLVKCYKNVPNCQAATCRVPNLHAPKHHPTNIFTKLPLGLRGPFVEHLSSTRKCDKI